MTADESVLCLIIDRSGSILPMVADIVGGINSFVEEQKKVGNANLVVFRFDDNVEMVYDGKLFDSPVFTVEDFRPRGMTALWDAVGVALDHIDKLTPDHHLTPENAPIIFVYTDGYENMSRKYNSDDLKQKVKKREENGWSINFVGAGIDACATGGQIGIVPSRCNSFGTDEGIAALRHASATVTRTRTGEGFQIIDEARSESC